MKFTNLVLCGLARILAKQKTSIKFGTIIGIHVLLTNIHILRGSIIFGGIRLSMAMLNKLKIGNMAAILRDLRRMKTI